MLSLSFFVLKRRIFVEVVKRKMQNSNLQVSGKERNRLASPHLWGGG